MQHSLNVQNSEYHHLINYHDTTFYQINSLNNLPILESILYRLVVARLSLQPSLAWCMLVFKFYTINGKIMDKNTKQTCQKYNFSPVLIFQMKNIVSVM